MEWYVAGGAALGAALLLMFLSVPVAFAFLAVSFGGMYLLTGLPGVLQVATNASVAVTNFAFLPIPLFLLMGELFFHTGVAQRVFDAVDVLIGRLRGRLSYVTVAGGTAYAALSGTSMGNTAMLGSLLVPEMTRRGYKPHMSMGPILATSGLAILIPPSSLAVLLGSTAKVDIGRLLIAGVLPGLVLAILFALTIFLLLRLDPTAAPEDSPRPRPLAEKLVVGLTQLLPMGFIIFLVIGLILLGIATPTEAAAFGVLGVLIVAAAFRSLTWAALRRSLEGALKVSAMVLLIVIASSTFSQLLAFSGASSGLVRTVRALDLPPEAIVVAMFLVLLVMGMFMEQVSIMMLSIPVFFPIVTALGLDPVWFGVVMLLSLEIAGITPPFGLNLFVMLGVAPPGTTLGQVARAVAPFLLACLTLFVLLMLFPGLALWLPGQMG